MKLTRNQSILTIAISLGKEGSSCYHKVSSGHENLRKPNSCDVSLSKNWKGFQNSSEFLVFCILLFWNSTLSSSSPEWLYLISESKPGFNFASIVTF